MARDAVSCPSVTMTCGISGGSGAGKTTLTHHLLKRLGESEVSVLAFDAYYRDQGHLTPAERSLVNYDHPDSLDHDLFATHVEALRTGSDIESPIYDFTTHTRTGETQRIKARDVVIVEGILLLSFSAIADGLDLAVFIDVPEDTRLERRILRDVRERGRMPEDVRRQFAETVAPMHDTFVEPYRHLAHRTVAMHEDYNDVADELIFSLRPARDLAG
jgi:uridine kinase